MNKIWHAKSFCCTPANFCCCHCYIHTLSALWFDECCVDIYVWLTHWFLPYFVFMCTVRGEGLVAWSFSFKWQLWVHVTMQFLFIFQVCHWIRSPWIWQDVIPVWVEWLLLHLFRFVFYLGIWICIIWKVTMPVHGLPFFWSTQNSVKTGCLQK